MITSDEIAIKNSRIRLLEARVAELEAQVSRLLKPRNFYVTTTELAEESSEKIFQEFWRPLLMESGGFDAQLEQTKKELADYYCQMAHWRKAICELTDGRMSYTTYTASAMISEVTDAFERSWREKQEFARSESEGCKP
jgi:hypothetical protein